MESFSAKKPVLYYLVSLYFLMTLTVGCVPSEPSDTSGESIPLPSQSTDVVQSTLTGSGCFVNPYNQTSIVLEDGWRIDSSESGTMTLTNYFVEELEMVHGVAKNWDDDYVKIVISVDEREEISQPLDAWYVARRDEIYAGNDRQPPETPSFNAYTLGELNGLTYSYIPLENGGDGPFDAPITRIILTRDNITVYTITILSSSESANLNLGLRILSTLIPSSNDSCLIAVY